MEKRHKAYDNLRFADLEYRPPSYIGLFGRLPILRSHHPIFCVFLIEVIPLMVYEGIRLVSRHQQNTNEALIVYAGSAITVLGTVLLISGYGQVKAAFQKFENVLERPESRRQFALDAARITGGIQDIWAAGFCVGGLLLVALLGPQLSGLWVAVAVVFGGPFFLISGYGLGFAVMTIRLIYSLQSYGQMKTFVLPARTPAIRALSRVTGVLALYFSIQLFCESTLCVAIRWKNIWVLHATLYTIVLPISIVAALFFVYPQLGIKRLIGACKRRELATIEAALQEMDYDATATYRDHNEVERLNNLLTLYRQIEESPSVPIDMATAFSAIGSILLPVLGSIVEGLTLEHLRFK
jgi:hypothetical protein